MTDTDTLIHDAAPETDSRNGAAVSSIFSDATAGDTPPKRRPGRPRKVVDGAGEPSGAPSSAPRARSTRDDVRKARIEALRGRLHDKVVEAGMGAGLVMPVTGTVLIRRADQWTDNLCRLAETDDRVLRAIERAMTASVMMDCVLMGVTLVIAIGVDRHIVPVQSLPAALVRPEIEAVNAMYAREASAPEPAA